MNRALLLAWSSPATGREADFEEWYNSTHIPQVRAAVPEVSEVDRYRLVDPDGSGEPARYLAVYQIDTDDVAAAAGSLGEAAATGALDMSDVLDAAAAPPVLQWLVKHTD